MSGPIPDILTPNQRRFSMYVLKLKERQLGGLSVSKNNAWDINGDSFLDVKRDFRLGIDNASSGR